MHQKQLVPLNRIIEDAVSMVTHQCSLQNITIHPDLNPNLPLINLDADKIKQVFLNLLMNAQQAMDGAGELRITTSFRESEGLEQATVWDSGRGIPPDGWKRSLTRSLAPKQQVRAPVWGCR